jgi:hypothetical protein
MESLVVTQLVPVGLPKVCLECEHVFWAGLLVVLPYPFYTDNLLSIFIVETIIIWKIAAYYHRQRVIP